MININFNGITTDELLEICKTLEDFLKYLADEETAMKKVLDEK